MNLHDKTIFSRAGNTVKHLVGVAPIDSLPIKKKGPQVLFLFFFLSLFLLTCWRLMLVSLKSLEETSQKETKQSNFLHNVNKPDE